MYRAESPKTHLSCRKDLMMDCLLCQARASPAWHFDTARLGLPSFHSGTQLSEALIISSVVAMKIVC